MLWRIPVEAIFALALFFFGRGFWAAAKSPGHLRKILGDPGALKRIIDEAECAHFCERERPEYKNLHQVLAAYKPQSG